MPRSNKTFRNQEIRKNNKNKKNNKTRRNRNLRGGNCGIVSKATPCASAVNVGQYVRPCSYLPLDGDNHNIQKNQIGGKKNKKNNKNNKKNNSRKSS